MNRLGSSLLLALAVATVPTATVDAASSPENPVWARLRFAFPEKEAVPDRRDPHRVTLVGKMCRQGPLPATRFELVGLPPELRGSFVLEGGPTGKWCLESTVWEAAGERQMVAPCLTLRIQVVAGDQVVWAQQSKVSALALTRLGVRSPNSKVELQVAAGESGNDWTRLVPWPTTTEPMPCRASGCEAGRHPLARHPVWGRFFAHALNCRDLLLFESPPASTHPLALPAPYRGEVRLAHSSKTGWVCGTMDEREDFMDLSVPGLTAHYRVWRQSTLVLEKTIRAHWLRLSPELLVYDEVSSPGLYVRRSGDPEYQRFVEEVTLADARCQQP